MSLDVDAYLEWIGFAGARTYDLATLAELLDPDDQVTVLFIERRDISTTTTTTTTTTIPG